MPLHIDPNVNYRRLGELSDEFTAHWNKLRSFYLDGAIGFMFVRQYVEENQRRARSYVQGSDMDSEEAQDSCGFMYSEILSENFVTSDIQVDKQGNVKRRNARDGANYVTLGHSCITSFYTFWEEYLRREYAIAKGVLKKDEADDKVIDKILSEHVKSDLWGDIGIFRNLIVHNHGLAGSKIEKCKVFKWFKPDDQLLITPTHMREIFMRLLSYRNELNAEQYPKSYIQL